MAMKKSEKEAPCQYYYPDLLYNTLPDPRTALPLRRIWWTLKRYIWYISVLGPFQFMKKLLSSKLFGKRPPLKGYNDTSDVGALNLQPGELVEVRSEKEIFATLDGEGKFRGLRFTPEMRKYCGKRFRVYKRLEKIILEATGELRTIKTPTVILEGVFCDGSAHGGCDRSCFCFWREKWLKRVAPKSPQKRKGKS